MGGFFGSRGSFTFQAFFRFLPDEGRSTGAGVVEGVPEVVEMSSGAGGGGGEGGGGNEGGDVGGSAPGLS